MQDLKSAPSSESEKFLPKRDHDRLKCHYEVKFSFYHFQEDSI